MSSQQLEPVVCYIRAFANSRLEQDDKQLLAGFIERGDEAAFATLVGRHGPLVWRACRHALGHEQDAEDVFQATFMLLARKAGAIRKRDSVGPWLFGVAHRLAMKVVRAAQRRRRHERQALERLAQEPSAAASLRDVQMILDDEVERLPEKYRVPFVLCCLEGKSQEQATRELGWKKGTFSARLAQARQKLKVRLVKRGLTLSAALCAVALDSGVSAALTPALLDSTTKAALSFASRSTGLAGVSSSALLLTREALQAMMLAKIGIALGLLLGMTLVFAGMTVVLFQAETSLDAAAPTPIQQAQPPTPLSDANKPRFDMDGQLLPAGARWRAGSLRLFHGSQFTALTYSPDGKMLAACSYDSIVRLWDTTTGKEIRHFQGPEGGVTSLAFSPAGDVLAMAGWGKAKVWPLRGSDQQPHELTGTEGKADALAFSRDGKHLTVVTKDHFIRVYETGTWRQLRHFAGPQSFCVGLSFLPEGKTLITGADDALQLWDAAQGRLSFSDKSLKGLWTIVLSPDGKSVAVAMTRNSVGIWDVAKRKLLSLTKVPEHASHCIAFSPDSRTLAASGGTDKTVRFLDATTGMERHRWTSFQFVSRLAFSPDGKVLAVGGDGMVRFREPETGKDLLPPPGLPADVTGLVFADRGKSVVAGGHNGFVGRWDVKTGKERAPLRSAPSAFVPPASMLVPSALSRGGRRIASVDNKWGVQVWDTGTGEIVRRIGAPQTYSSVSLSPDGKTVAVAHEDKSLRLWDVDSGKETRRFAEPKGTEYPQISLFSDDGKILAAGYSNGVVRVLEIATGRELQRFQTGPVTPHQMAFSPDGRLLASGHHSMMEREFAARNRYTASNDDSALRLWDVTTGKGLRRFKVVSPALDSIAFSRDGRTVATGIGIHVRLWETCTGAERLDLIGHRSSIWGLAFSPDDRTLATGSLDRTAVVWDLAEACGAHLGVPSSGRLEDLWSDLGAAATRAYRAVWQLASAGKQAVPFLRQRLRPIPALDRQQISRLLADLDSKQFPVREKATKELEKLGDLVGPFLSKALAAQPSLEQHQRLEKILAKLDGPVISTAELQTIRSIEVLERVGTDRARQLLEVLSAGAPEARVTREATESLQRLASRMGQ
jgi:RNA polymerase sigma factor (sigma-70 family)